MSYTLPEASIDSPQQIIFGADVIMTKSKGDITLHAPGQNGRELIGRFGSVADAWQALDELDAPEGLDAAYRAA